MDNKTVLHVCININHEYDLRMYISDDRTREYVRDPRVYYILYPVYSVSV